MKKNRIFISIFFGFFFITSVFGEGSTDHFAPSKRQVYIDCEIGVNYIVHMYTIAGAGFSDQEYVKKYQNTVSEMEREYLQKNAHLLSFLRNDNGPFANAFYFVPTQYNWQSKIEYEKYFADWETALKTKSFGPLEKYSDSWIDNYRNLFNQDDKAWQDNTLSLQPAFKRLAEIFTGNIETYKKTVWPEVKPVLGAKARALNEKISKFDLIPRWEKATGYTWGDRGYLISIFLAGKNGPSFNNTSLTKNTAYYNWNESEIIGMISHELGIHMLFTHIDYLMTKYGQEMPRINSPYIYGNVPYMASETLASFYNRKVLNYEEPLICSNDPLAFLEIYHQLEKKSQNPEELFQKGIEEYLKHWTDPKSIEERYIKCKNSFN